jgi:sugar phosphate isomerase/epimerase
MLAISTAWRSRKSRSGLALIEDLRKIPANALELEFRIPPAMFDQMRPLLDHGEFTVVSLHNYFPVPDLLMPSEGSGDAFLLSSEDEEERKLAVKYSAKTLETAAELGAACVVFHLGLIPLEYTKRSIMKSLIEEALGSNSWKMRDTVKLMREANRQKHLTNSIRSLEELIPHAEKSGVAICLENRFYPTEIPNLEEMHFIFEKFQGAPILYWHDVGHAVVQERLGFDRAEDLLRENASRIAGIHLHDVRGFEDHLAPGLGEVDFAHLLSVLPDSMIHVVEVHEQVTAEELGRAVRFLTSLGFGKQGEQKR